MESDDVDPHTPSERPPVAAAPRLGAVARRLAQAAGMAVAVTVGVGVFLLLPRPRPQPPAPAPRMAEAIPLAPPAAPSVAPLFPAAEPFVLSPPEPPALRPRIAPPAPKRHAETAIHELRPHAPARRIEAVVAKRPPAVACRAPAAEADRLVCSQPALAAQDRRMREAYADALAAGNDRLRIDRGQALWHGARDRATTGPQLAQLYARRIADLEAAARNPRRPHPIGG
jgi:uncharacterized protein YecT (DUF1311 family)